MHTGALPSIATQVQRLGYKQQVLNQIKDTLSSIRALFEDESVTEIMVNAPHEVFVSKQGRNVRVPVRLGAPEISAAITLIASLVAKEVGEKSGRRILSARLPGFRIEAILPPVAVRGPAMCIRRHAARVFSIDEYVASGTISPEYAQLLQDVIDARENFLIVGGTGSGKTTLMNTALSMIPKDQRLFVIETVHELQLVADDHMLVECDADQGVTPRAAVQAALRFFPWRIIVGELRGPEAYDWLDGGNTGHPGSAATIHANSASKALPRLENLLLMADRGVPYESIRAAIANDPLWMFYIERNGAKRKVSQVSQLLGYDRRKGDYDVKTH